MLMLCREEVIIQLLDGPVMECVLCDGYPR